MGWLALLGLAALVASGCSLQRKKRKLSATTLALPIIQVIISPNAAAVAPGQAPGDDADPEPADLDANGDTDDSADWRAPTPPAPIPAEPEVF